MSNPAFETELNDNSLPNTDYRPNHRSKHKYAINDHSEK